MTPRSDGGLRSRSFRERVIFRLVIKRRPGIPPDAGGVGSIVAIASLAGRIVRFFLD